MLPGRGLPCGLLAIALGSTVAAAVRAGDDPPAPRTEHVEVHSISVPVQVTVGGEPVRGLERDDFELFDRGKRQEIRGFEVIDLELVKQDAGRAWDRDIPMAGRRHFLVVFDLSFVRLGSIQLARREIRDWLLDALDPTDLVAIATYSLNAGPRLRLGFSADREQLVEAVDHLGRPDLAGHNDDPLVISAGAIKDQTAVLDFDDALEYGYSQTDENSDYALLQRDIFMGASQRLVDQERRQPIQRLSRNFAELAHMMRSVEGRKYVLYLSEGFDSSLVFADYSSDRIADANRALEVGVTWQVDSTRRFGSATTQASIVAMLDEFRRADCVIQAVDLGKFRNPTGVRTVPTFSESLLLMANHTGGELHRDFDDVGDALESVLRATSVTYVLWFTPRDGGGDGAFRNIKVKLRNRPKKAKISHRAGYSMPTPLSAQGPDERRMSVGQMVLGGRDGGSLATSVLARPFRLDSEKALVPVLVEVDGLSLAGNRRHGRIEAEIYAYAFDAQGGLGDFFTQTVQVDLDRVGTFLRERGLKFYGELELPAGGYSLRTLVIERETGITGLRILPLEVPAYADGAVALSPMFPESRGIWLLVREARLERQTDPSRFPFLLGIEPYLPAAAPTIRVEDEPLLYVPVYNLSEGPAAIRASILSLDGTPVRDLDLPLLGRGRGGPDGAETLVTRLPAGTLASGQYRIVLTVVESDGDGATTRPVPFDVTGS